jgi:hypothetical protein
MSTPWWVVLVVGPFLALVLLLGTVAIVALCKARQEDIPTVLSMFKDGFEQLVQQVPAPRLPGDDETDDTEAVIQVDVTTAIEMDEQQ